MTPNSTWFAAQTLPWLGPVLVALGGAAGAIVRYATSSLINNRQSARNTRSRRPKLPWGTITVNLIGSLLIGVLSVAVPVLIARAHPAPEAASLAWVRLGQLLFITGFCGGFTTFSTAMVETVTLARSGQLAAALRSVLITFFGAVVAVIAGSSLVGLLLY